MKACKCVSLRSDLTNHIVDKIYGHFIDRTNVHIVGQITGHSIDRIIDEILLTRI